MITLTISYISLVAAEPAGTGARIAFPKATSGAGHKHVLEIFLTRGGTTTQLTSGSRIGLEITENNAPVNLKTPAGLPMGGRVFSIADASGGGPYTLKSNADLLKASGPAQAVLHVHGGTFAAKSPLTPSQYKNKFWDIDGKSRQLTDNVQWTLPTLGKYSYALDIDGTRTQLLSGDELTFTNDDVPRKYFKDNGTGFVEMTDADYLYDLVDPAPAKRPRPKTPYVGPGPAPNPPGVLNAPSDVQFGGGDLPLCPVGEP